MVIPYGAEVRKARYHDNLRREMLAFIPHTARCILDVGCYTGEFAQLVQDSLGVEVWGVDPDPRAIAICMTKISHAVCAAFDDRAELPEDYFDTIVFNDSLEHFCAPEQALRLARRKLVVGGYLVCSIPNMRQIDNLEHLLFDKDWRYEEAGIRDKTHMRFFTRKSMVRLFTENNFQVLTVQGINPAYWHPKKYFRRLLFKVFPDFFEDMKYTQYAIVCKSMP
jgi:SAM-dependent methyltransferase